MRSILISVAVLVAAISTASEPAWWGDRGVVSADREPQDFAAANQGQVKHMAYQAYLHMVEVASQFGGAGPAVSNRVHAFGPEDNYAAINQGQLKALAAVFYDRLIEIGYATNYPWADNPNPPQDFAMASIGQVKNLFSFDLATDTDEDGLPDWWEVLHGLDPLDDGSLNPDNGADGDPDGDGLTNLEEYQLGTNPSLADTSGDGMDDGTAYTLGFNPTISNAAVQVWLETPQDGWRFP